MAITSATIGLAVAGLWYRSVSLVDAADHRSAMVVDGRYARRVWTVMSAGGYFEVGREADVPTSSATADKLRVVDRSYGLGWHATFPVESVEGNTREILWAGLIRLACYSTLCRRPWYVTTGRFVEVPDAVPLIGCLIAPATAVVRRRRRLRRERATSGPVVAESR